MLNKALRQPEALTADTDRQLNSNVYRALVLNQESFLRIHRTARAD